MIIAFFGPKGHGKNTCAEMINEKMNLNAQFLAFADPIKRICKEMFGWDDSYFHGEKKEEVDYKWGISPRKVMQYIGTEVGQYGLSELSPIFRTITGRTLWSKRLTKDHDENRNLIITDMRFPHEHTWVYRYAQHLNTPYYTIRVERPGIKREDFHISETEYMNIPPSCIVVNEDLDILQYQMDIVIEEVIESES